MVRLSCGVQCSRRILIALNIIFLLFGFAIFGVGIYVKVNGNFSAIIAAYNITQALGGAAMQWISTIMIIVGICTCGLSLFGCLGAVYKNRVFLYIYALIFALIILLEFAAVIVTLKYRNDLWQSYDSGFQKVFEDAYHNNHTETIKIIEELERQFKCCGVNGVVDYTRPRYAIPNSCYPNEIPQGAPFDQGCATAVTLWVWNGLPYIVAVVGSILFIEVFGIISSLVIGVAITHASNDDDDDYYHT